MNPVLSSYVSSLIIHLWFVVGPLVSYLHFQQHPTTAVSAGCSLLRPSRVTHGILSWSVWVTSDGCSRCFLKCVSWDIHKENTKLSISKICTITLFNDFDDVNPLGPFVCLLKGSYFPFPSVLKPEVLSYMFLDTTYNLLVQNLRRLSIGFVNKTPWVWGDVSNQEWRFAIWLYYMNVYDLLIKMLRCWLDMVAEGLIRWKSFKHEKAKTDGYLFLNGERHAQRVNPRVKVPHTVDTTRRDPSPLNHVYKFEFCHKQPFPGALQSD